MSKYTKDGESSADIYLKWKKKESGMGRIQP